MNINATIIGQSIAFIVFVWFCMKYVWPPIMSALEARKKEIADGLAAAAQAQLNLEESTKKVEEQLLEAREEAKTIVALANKRANKIVDEAKVQAVVEAGRIKLSKKAEIEQELTMAKEALRVEIGQLMVIGAERIIGKNIDNVSNEQLVDDLVSGL